MKKLFSLLALLPLIACFIMPQTALAKRVRSFQDLLSKVDTIKIYVEDIQISTGDNKIKVKDLQDQISKALKDRISTDFVIVTNPAEALVILKSDIIEYYWTLVDPIDQIHSYGAIAKDILIKEHYVRMTIEFSLLYVPTDKVIWEMPVKATITDKDMTEEESYSLINDRMGKVLLRNLFKKKRGNRDQVESL